MTEPNVSQTLIAIDAGTTGVTCILFDAELAPIARAYREFAQGFPRPGWVEHEASAILGALDEVLAEILAHPRAGEVAAIGVTNQRETIFAIDAVEGTALGPGIVWQDRRTADRCTALRAGGHEPLIRERTGLVLDPYFSASKIQWMLEQDDELRDRAEQGGVKFCTVDALVVEHLTGGAVCATDPTNASRTMLYDIESRDWSEELLELFGVEREWLPEVRPSRGDFGVTDAERFGRAIPVRGVAGDQQAALFGQGCWEPGELKATYGTGCFLLLNSGSQRSDVSGLLSTLALNAEGAPCFAIEGSVFIGGALIQWLRDKLGFFADAAESEALAASVEDSAGVYVVPAFTGAGRALLGRRRARCGPGTVARGRPRRDHARRARGHRVPDHGADRTLEGRDGPRGRGAACRRGRHGQRSPDGDPGRPRGRGRPPRQLLRSDGARRGSPGGPGNRALGGPRRAEAPARARGALRAPPGPDGPLRPARGLAPGGRARAVVSA